MTESIFSTASVLLTPTSIINFTSALAVLGLGYFIYSRDRGSVANQLSLLVAIFLAFWALSSTLSDVMHSPRPAMIWAQLAIIGPYFFAAYFLLFSHVFPTPSGRLGWLKATMIMLPSLAVCMLVTSPLNVVEIRLADWGTDFTPGPLYPIGILYLLLYLGLATANFVRSLRRTTDPLVRKQVKIVLLAVALQTLSMITTNALLPLLFNYTKASVIGPASSLFFVVLMMYAVLKHGFLSVKVLASEMFAITLTFVSFITLFDARSVAGYVRNLVVFLATGGVGLLLANSVSAEVRRREQLQLLTTELRRANEHLKDVDKLKSEFISIASHQLRTPISVIKGYLSLLIEGAYGACAPMATEKIRQMFAMNERLVHMVNNMLNVSRIEKDKIEFDCKLFDVAEVIRQTVAELALTVEQKGLKLEFVSPPAKPVRAFADPERLHEVLGNLIDNAVKYSEQGGIEVRLKARAKEGVAVITVKDEGIGMAPEDRKHIFEKFFRAREPAVAHQAGTGLGLYICARFLRGMGGDIKIGRTELGKGTTFEVVLPMREGIQCALRDDEAQHGQP